MSNCLGVNCNGNGVCEPLGDAYTCKCNVGYSGKNCENSEGKDF